MKYGRCRRQEPMGSLPSDGSLTCSLEAGLLCGFWSLPHRGSVNGDEAQAVVYTWLSFSSTI